jgi:TnsA endonuclease-like protein
MALKRKPPAGNIRRIAPIGNNLRYTMRSKADETVQCESFQERKLTLLFERDDSVLEYRSQPERFAFTDSCGKSHTYVPDFMVWRTTGEIEIHEFPLTERQNRFSIQECEKAACSICQQRGWRYIVHTEATLPQATEEANLLVLIPELSHTLSLPEPTVISALCHLLWHCVIETDLTSGLLFVNAALTPSVQVWLNEKRRRA